MDARRQAFRADDPEAFRQAVLRQVQDLTADNQRLLASVVKSEKRFRRLAKSVWHVQEEERRRLARELHDGIGQILTALANQLQRIHDDARVTENLGLGQRLADALEITRGALHDTRELSRLLRPTLLDDLGLEAALNWLGRTLSERAGIRIEVHSTLGERRLAADVETLVFRITQEALTNVMRHSAASEVQILLACGGGILKLQVRDDGRGFDPETVVAAQSGHFGLVGMRERAARLGATLTIDGQPGRGTTVEVKVPLPAPARGAHG